MIMTPFESQVDVDTEKYNRCYQEIPHSTILYCCLKSCEFGVIILFIVNETKMKHLINMKMQIVRCKITPMRVNIITITNSNKINMHPHTHSLVSL